MVLDGSSASSLPSDFSSDPSAPTSSPDPYSSGGGSPTYRIDPAHVHLPYSLRALFTGSPPQATYAFLQRSLTSHTALLKRPLTQSEVDAVTEHYSRASATASLGSPIGTAAGVYMAYRGRETYRFPFYTPKHVSAGGWFDPEYFGRYGRGFVNARAVMAWQALRYGTYGLLGSFFGRSLFTLWALSKAFMDEGRDDRMKEIHKRRIKMVEEARREGKTKAPGQRPAGQNAQGGLPSPDVSRKPRKTTYDDDASPTGGGLDGDNDARSLAAVGSGDGILSDEQMQAQEGQQRARDRGGRETDPTSSASFQMDRVTSQPGGFDAFGSDDDDASPTTQPSSTTSPKGSAWDRVRQGASNTSSPAASSSSWPPSSPSSSRPSQPSTPATSESWSRARRASLENRDESRSRDSAPNSSTAGGDSFSFSSGDQDRQLAREEAQRAFDERVERERRGGDFGSGGDVGGQEENGSKGMWRGRRGSD